MDDATWANYAIECCLRHGIDHYFLAPGSRCTPLTLAVANSERTNVTQHFDERGLAFAALGYGKATGRAGVFICTSGTAVANAYPAVIEAAMSGVPLLLFTADRPEELYGTGANQTIDQLEIFGKYPRLFLNVPPPENKPVDSRDRLTALGETLFEAFRETTFGPVHTNWMFREPFTITDCPPDADNATAGSSDPASRRWSEQRSPAGSEGTIPMGAADCRVEVQRNLLIALGDCKPDEASEALRLAERFQCPLLADVTSGLQASSFDTTKISSLPTPNTILHLGGRIVSKSWLQWTSDFKDTQVDYIHVTPTGQTINPNSLNIQKHWTALKDLELKIDGPPSNPEFTAAWTTASKCLQDSIASVFASYSSPDNANANRLSEPFIARYLSQSCPSDSGLFLGNSTPIRDMDWYGNHDAHITRNTHVTRHIAANRGASGIDGLLATAVGFAEGLRSMTTVVIGDLSALHDLNSLSLVAQSKQPLIIIVINNHGGHIFDLLPIRESKHFEQYFATPHAYQFEGAARMFGLPYAKADCCSVFAENYEQALSRKQSVVLEAITERAFNLQVRNKINEEILRCAAEN